MDVVCNPRRPWETCKCILEEEGRGKGVCISQGRGSIAHHGVARVWFADHQVYLVLQPSEAMRDIVNCILRAGRGWKGVTLYCGAAHEQFADLYAMGEVEGACYRCFHTRVFVPDKSWYCFNSRNDVRRCWPMPIDSSMSASYAVVSHLTLQACSIHQRFNSCH